MSRIPVFAAVALGLILFNGTNPAQVRLRRMHSPLGSSTEASERRITIPPLSQFNRANVKDLLAPSPN